MNLSLLHTPGFETLFWLLLHSVWQGTILAGLAYLVRRKRAPRVRYAIALACVVLFLVAQGLTFSILVGRASSYASTFSQSSVPDEAELREFVASRVVANTRNLGWPDLTQQMTWHVVLNRITWVGVWLICLWFVFALFLMTRQAIALVWLGRIVTRQPPVSPEHQAHFAKLADRLGITSTVEFRQTDALATAAACGWRRPTVLIGARCLAQFDQPKLNALVLHELAHIRRGDFLAGLIVGFTNAIYFINPFVRRLKKMVDRDQELCCDETASGVAEELGFPRDDYAMLLVECARFPRGDLLLNFSPAAKDGSLKSRVLQLLHPHGANAELSWPKMAGMAIAVVLLMVGIAKPMSQFADADRTIAWAQSMDFGEATLRTFNLRADNPEALGAIVHVMNAAREAANDPNKLLNDPRYQQMIQILSKGGDVNVLRELYVEHVGLNPSTRYIPNWPVEDHRDKLFLYRTLQADFRQGTPEEQIAKASAAFVFAAMTGPFGDYPGVTRLLNDSGWALAMRCKVEQIDTALVLVGLRSFQIHQLMQLQQALEQKDLRPVDRALIRSTIANARYSPSRQALLASFFRNHQVTISEADLRGSRSGSEKADEFRVLRRLLHQR